MSAPAAPATPSAEAQAFMKQSFRYSEMDAALAADATLQALYSEVQKGIVRNVKTKPGGFLATSGVVLPYYLNLSTNFMDPRNAGRIVGLVSWLLLRLHPTIAASPDERIAVCGMEVAGGMLVSQLAVTDNAELHSKFDFVYMRKQRKSTGTAQQLEGLKMFTERTPESAPLKTIWVDDVNSTGSSLSTGIDILAEDYNMHVVSAVYVVDRSVDRANITDPARMYYARDRFVQGVTKVYTLMDLAEIDPMVPRE